MEITVTDPKKVGDGMGAYMAFRVNTKVRSSLLNMSCATESISLKRTEYNVGVSLSLQTTLPQFRSKELCVYRRFSDFLGLHEKLAEKHQHLGRIIPPPPEKSVVGKS